MIALYLDSQQLKAGITVVCIMPSKSFVMNVIASFTSHVYTGNFLGMRVSTSEKPERRRIRISSAKSVQGHDLRLGSALQSVGRRKLEIPKNGLDGLLLLPAHSHSLSG